jgi:hypothetical protein
MTDQLWTVTHATVSGEWRSWTVDFDEAQTIIEAIADRSLPDRLPIDTTTGTALIWLTPGQSLTVERAR